MKVKMGKVIKPDLSILVENWPPPFCARESVGKFSGGILNSKTMANSDSQGVGPEGRIRIGRKICYNVKSLVAWLEKRAEVVEK